MGCRARLAWELDLHLTHEEFVTAMLHSMHKHAKSVSLMNMPSNLMPRVFKELLISVDPNSSADVERVQIAKGICLMREFLFDA